jgi:hypothetical protein
MTKMDPYSKIEILPKKLGVISSLELKVDTFSFLGDN